MSNTTSLQPLQMPPVPANEIARMTADGYLTVDWPKLHESAANWQPGNKSDNLAKMLVMMIEASPELAAARAERDAAREVLRHVRFHANRHDLDRTWLTVADDVLGTFRPARHDAVVISEEHLRVVAERDQLRVALDSAQAGPECVRAALRTDWSDPAGDPSDAEIDALADEFDDECGRIKVIDFARAVLALRQAAPRVQEPSPTAGMNIAQRILHVGGRNNAAGYVEFGSIQAVQALVNQVLRDLPASAQEPATAPRQPLTDDLIAEIDRETDDIEVESNGAQEFARAIERACAEAWGVTLMGAPE